MTQNSVASAINKQVSRCVLTTKIFRMDSLANFLSYGVPLELAFALTKRHIWQHLCQTFDLNLRHNWRHLWHIFDLSLRRTHLMTLLASLWLESQTLSYRTFVKSLARISDMTTPLTGRHKCLSNSYTLWRPLKVRVKGVTKWPLSPDNPPETVVKDQNLSRVKGVQRCAKVVFVAPLTAPLTLGKSMISFRDRVPTARCSGFTFPLIYMYIEYRYTHTRNLLPIASFLSSAWSTHSGALARKARQRSTMG